MERATAQFLALPPGAIGRAKRSKVIKFQQGSRFQSFYAKFFCLFSQIKDKAYWTGCLFCRLGHAPGVGIGGAWGTQGGKKFEHGHVAYQIERDGRQNRMQVKISFLGGQKVKCH